MKVDQRAPGIAWVDWRISLDEAPRIPLSERPVGGTDNAAGHALAQPERIADRDYKIPDFNLATIAKWQGRQVLCVDLEHGQIEVRRDTERLRPVFSSIFQ